MSNSVWRAAPKLPSGSRDARAMFYSARKEVLRSDFAHARSIFRKAANSFLTAAEQSLSLEAKQACLHSAAEAFLEGGFTKDASFFAKKALSLPSDGLDPLTVHLLALTEARAAILHGLPSSWKVDWIAQDSDQEYDLIVTRDDGLSAKILFRELKPDNAER